MKPTKHLETLAHEMTRTDIKASSWRTEEHYSDYYAVNLEMLTRLRDALLKGRLYFRVDRVSRSGMSRHIEIAYIKGNELYKVTDPFLLRLAGCDRSGRINGCGMDMLFHSQYTLFQNLCPGMRYQDKMPRYKTM